MKRLLLILTVFIILFWGCSKNNIEKISLEKKAITVKVEKVKKGVFRKYLTYKGTIYPWKKANIGPNTSGRIWKIYKKQGDMVEKNTLLAELDTTTLKLQLKQAEAALEVAKASYKDALLNLNRLKKLFEKNAISQLQLEKAQLALEASDTQKESAEANLNMVKHNLENSYMRAPFDGIITSKNMEEGDMINPMMGMGSSVLTLMDLSNVKIVLDVPAEDIEKIKIGQNCLTTVYSLKNEVFEGNIYSKNLAADPISKTFKVEVKIKNPEIQIKAGVFAEVKVEILTKKDVLTLPLSALIDNSFVVLYETGKAKNTQIKVGEKNEKEFEILSGLSEGQQVVVEGNYDLKEGTLISIEGATQ